MSGHGGSQAYGGNITTISVQMGGDEHCDGTVYYSVIYGYQSNSNSANAQVDDSAMKHTCDYINCLDVYDSHYFYVSGSGGASPQTDDYECDYPG